MRSLSMALALFLFFTSLSFGDLVGHSEKDNCNVYHCMAWSVKVCNEKIYCRDYSCENECTDKNVTDFRENGSVDGVGYGLKHYLENNRCSCPVRWHKCSSENFYKDYIDTYGEENICQAYSYTGI